MKLYSLYVLSHLVFSWIIPMKEDRNKAILSTMRPVTIWGDAIEEPESAEDFAFAVINVQINIPEPYIRTSN